MKQHLWRMLWALLERSRQYFVNNAKESAEKKNNKQIQGKSNEKQQIVAEDQQS